MNNQEQQLLQRGGTDQGNVGLTTVWLLSMLSNPRVVKESSSVSNISKKDVMRVSIPGACCMLKNNGNNYSLRHISHLLYGISLCYTKKTNYVLTDLGILLAQLHRASFYRNKIMTSAGEQRKYSYTNGESHLSQKMSINSNQEFLKDDPNFNIEDLADFDQFLNTNRLDGNGNGVVHAIEIRKHDFLNEITNTNNFDVAQDLTFARPDSNSALYRNRTVEELPIDMDFNLDIDDLEDNESKKKEVSVDNVSEINYDTKERRASLGFATNYHMSLDNQENDVPNFDLMIEPQDENDIMCILNGEENSTAIENSLRDNKVNVGNSTIRQNITKIKTDERISLSTDLLRKNHANYLCTMEEPKESRLIVAKCFSEVKSEFNSGCSSKLLKRCWDFSLSSDIHIFKRPRKVEEGREKNSIAESNSLNGSVRSIEYNRNVEYFFNSQDNNEHEQHINFPDNLLLNLEQINEELEERESFMEDNAAERMSDLIDINLHLPPSSFSLNTSQMNTKEGEGIGNGTINILDWDKREGELSSIQITTKNLNELENSHQEKCFSSSNHDPSLVKRALDHQTQMFYNNLLEKSNPNDQQNDKGHFKHHTFFSSVVPQSVETSTTHSLCQISRKIAAGAFFSILNLASMDLIEIERQGVAEYAVGLGDNFKIYI